jgi:hypothetical protein
MDDIVLVNAQLDAFQAAESKARRRAEIEARLKGGRSR